MAAPTSAFYLHRASNSQWQASDGLGAESAGAVLGLGLYQGYVDFDMLGEQFWIVFGFNMASSGLSNQIWRVRIGGTYNTPDMLASVLDGDVGLEQTISVGAFACGQVKQLVDNVWTGVKLVTLTGQVAGAGAFAQAPTIAFVPVL
jgi:hypothetical protein